MHGFILYSKTVLWRAVKSGLARGVGVLLGLLLGIATLSLQMACGLIPAKDAHGRWLALLWPHVALLASLALGYVWHAAWQTHRDGQRELSIERSRSAFLQKAGAVNLLADEAKSLARLLKELFRMNDDQKERADLRVPLAHATFPLEPAKWVWGHREMCRFLGSYLRHLSNVKSVLPDFESDIVKYGFPNELNDNQLIKMLDVHADELAKQAASLVSPQTD